MIDATRDDALCYMPATEALARFRDRSLSPVELMAAVIDRTERVEPMINAFTVCRFEEAMDRAREAEARYGRTGALLRPLEGLPVAIKDSSDLAGWPTSMGSLLASDAPAARSAPINARVMRAGAIAHARSATPEFSCASITHSRRWGTTRNPWNAGMTPGGSSGGAGAALAAGMATLATGSDIGGSIRIPASCCGVVGYKPPYGRNPGTPPFNLDPYCHTGPMARTVADTILLQNVMCGPHREDIATLRPRLRLPLAYPPIAGMRIAFSMTLGAYGVDPAVRANTMAALDVFRGLGAVVEEVDLPWGPECQEAAIQHLTHIFGTSIAPALAQGADQLTPYARAFGEAAKRSRPDHMLSAMQVAADMYRTLAPILAWADVLVCPTTALPAVPADFEPTEAHLTIDGREVHPMLGWVMTKPFNMLSRLPVLSVPSGRAPCGTPTGIQIVGGSFADADVFRAAMAYEAAAEPRYATEATRPTLRA